MRNKKSGSLEHADCWFPTFSFLIPTFLFLILFTSCSLQQQISRSASKVIHDPSLQSAHIGISIYEPATGRYWYDYNGEKYFVPASNTKIPTCYAAMKYLGDSLPGIKYAFSETIDSSKMLLCIQPTGDPTFLHRRFQHQAVFDFIKKYTPAAGIAVLDTIWQDEAWGDGWSWNDYNSNYMAERSALPVYGNTIRFIQVKEVKFDGRYSPDNFIYTEPAINWEINLSIDTGNKQFFVQRDQWRNSFRVKEGTEEYKEQDMPFVTNGKLSALELLKDTLPAEYQELLQKKEGGRSRYETVKDDKHSPIRIDAWKTIYSRPTDSLLQPMMHRSDNFFAEQALLMVSNKKTGVMNDEKVIDMLLKTDLKDLPQKPRWVDGSGLSRYNLFSPKDFVFILNKMKNEFGMERITIIFPTGGEGTLGNYYLADTNHFYAKTGSLSGVIALSGYLYTKKNKLLIFSVLVNNHQASAATVRRLVEKFLQGVRNK